EEYRDHIRLIRQLRLAHHNPEVPMSARNRWWLASARANKPARARLSVEVLEARDVPSVSLASGALGSATTTSNGFTEAYPPGTITNDGRYLVFTSSGTNLVAGQVDQNGGYNASDPEAGRDVFLRDTVTNTTTLISHTAASASTTGNGESIVPYI